jgi:hypothetical protein
VDEQQERAGAGFHVVEADAVDLGERVLERSLFGHYHLVSHGLRHEVVVIRRIHVQNFQLEKSALPNL